jgi:hypothetical protein
LPAHVRVFAKFFDWLSTGFSGAHHYAVPAFAAKLEETQPQAFAELYKGYSMKNLDMKADGTIHFLGRPVFVPNADGMPTLGAATITQSLYKGASPAVVDVAVQDFMAIAKYPYLRELPQAFFDLMAADMDGLLAGDYRHYIRHEIKPAIDRVADILHAHFAAIEAPPLEWLVEKFPGHSGFDSPNTIVDDMIGYTRAWDRVLAEWDAGRLERLFPPNHMMPWTGLGKFNTWSKERGETKQQELIGMSAGRKGATAKAQSAVVHSIIASEQNALAGEHASEV